MGVFLLDKLEKRNDQEDEYHLSRHTEHRPPFESNPRMDPAVKALEPGCRGMRKAEIDELQEVGSDAADRADQSRSQKIWIAEDQCGQNKPEECIPADAQAIEKKQTGKLELSALGRMDRVREYRIVPMRDGVEQKMAAEARAKTEHGMARHKGGKSGAGNGMGSERH